MMVAHGERLQPIDERPGTFNQRVAKWGIDSTR
jgi:hypothetical protein